jgi:hypothetical protein
MVGFSPRGDGTELSARRLTKSDQVVDTIVALLERFRYDHRRSSSAETRSECTRLTGAEDVEQTKVGPWFAKWGMITSRSSTVMSGGAGQKCAFLAGAGLSSSRQPVTLKQGSENAAPKLTISNFASFGFVHDVAQERTFVYSSGPRLCSVIGQFSPKKALFSPVSRRFGRASGAVNRGLSSRGIGI